LAIASPSSGFRQLELASPTTGPRNLAAICDDEIHRLPFSRPLATSWAGDSPLPAGRRPARLTSPQAGAAARARRGSSVGRVTSNTDDRDCLRGRDDTMPSPGAFWTEAPAVSFPPWLWLPPCSSCPRRRAQCLAIPGTRRSAPPQPEREATMQY
jgi:hypothetical protein